VELPQCRELPGAQAPGPLDAEVGLGVVSSRLGLEGGHDLALLPDPLEPSLLRELRLEPLPQRAQVLDVGQRVGLLLRGEGPPRPVVLPTAASPIPGMPRKRAAIIVSNRLAKVKPKSRLSVVTS
jgi:hypothetical protein